VDGLPGQVWLIDRAGPFRNGCPARSSEFDLLMVVVVMVPLFDGVLVLLGRDRMLVRMLVPIRMVLIDPVGMMVVPPVAIVPFVMFVEVAFITPVGMILGPFGMMGPHPAAIVIVPPVSLVPSVIWAVRAPAVVVR
jgi:hypothetical protein